MCLHQVSLFLASTVKVMHFFALRASRNHRLDTWKRLARLCMHSGQKAQQVARVFNKCCVSPIMTFVSRDDRLLEKLSPESEWLALPNPANGAPFGHCENTVPVQPQEKRILREDRSSEKRKVWERDKDPGAPRNYYLLSLIHI